MRYHRKQQLIDKPVQLRMAAGMALHWVLYFLFILLAIPVWQMLTVSGFSKPFSVVVVESWAHMTPVFLFLATLLPIFIWESIKFSNRFVGPIYRLRTTMRALNAGEPFEPIRFRKRDFWHDVAEEFNTLMERLERQGSDPEPAELRTETRKEQETLEPVAVG